MLYIESVSNVYRGQYVLRIPNQAKVSNFTFTPRFNPTGLTTIRRKIGTGPLGQRNGLSPKDAQELNRYYRCNRAGEDIIIRDDSS